MSETLSALWADERGFVFSAELVLVATITVIGLVAGLTCLRNALVDELTELGSAFRSLNQSYAFGGTRGCWSWCGLRSWTAGSAYGTCVPTMAVYEPPALPRLIPFPANSARRMGR